MKEGWPTMQRHVLLVTGTNLDTTNPEVTFSGSANIDEFCREYATGMGPSDGKF